MPASLAVALTAVTVAQSALLSNQFPPLYDAASGGHHLTLAPCLVGFIRLVVIVCAAIFGLQAGCEASFGQYRSTLHLTPWWGAFVWAASASGTVLRYLDFGFAPGLVLLNIAAHIFRCGGVSRPTRLV